MKPIQYIDRTTGQVLLEQVYGGAALDFLYGKGILNRLIGAPLSHFLSKCSSVSALVGWWQKQPWTRRKILPFIKRFHIDESEFLKPVKDFDSFNDFFVRKLKKNTRPLSPEANIALIPADARYRFISNIAESDGFIVKGKKFSLRELLEDDELATMYAQGSLVMARLCPVDYHRFHFPCDGLPTTAKQINGYLFSVNPIALKQNIQIYTQNKRVITSIDTDLFKRILYIEVGATNVGSINQTYQANAPCKRGDEKGFFSFGGSALLLIFPPNTIQFSEDLLKHSKSGLEIFCRMGQPMGTCRH